MSAKQWESKCNESLVQTSMNGIIKFTSHGQNPHAEELYFITKMK